MYEKMNDDKNREGDGMGKKETAITQLQMFKKNLQKKYV